MQRRPKPKGLPQKPQRDLRWGHARLERIADGLIWSDCGPIDALIRKIKVEAERGRALFRQAFPTWR